MARALHVPCPAPVTQLRQDLLFFDSFLLSNHVLSGVSSWSPGMAPSSFSHPARPAGPWGWGSGAVG